MSWLRRSGWEHVCKIPTVHWDSKVVIGNVWRCKCGRRFELTDMQYPGSYQELEKDDSGEPEELETEEQDDELFAFLEGSW
jgi:hypothetical protein